MPAKALIHVDLRIAALRELAAQGRGDAEVFEEMRELLKQRGELIQKIVSERAGEDPPPPPIGGAKNFSGDW